ncbi:MAG: hypothetical protein H7338_04770 [Candidatus Sericytochromatia bacterium]|nr:hypothetical protein [Candidatus Sericytochromatia bacterium]
MQLPAANGVWWYTLRVGTNRIKQPNEVTATADRVAEIKQLFQARQLDLVMAPT